MSRSNQGDKQLIQVEYLNGKYDNVWCSAYQYLPNMKTARFTHANGKETTLDKVKACVDLTESNRNNPVDLQIKRPADTAADAEKLSKSDKRHKPMLMESDFGDDTNNNNNNNNNNNKVLARDSPIPNDFHDDVIPIWTGECPVEGTDYSDYKCGHEKVCKIEMSSSEKNPGRYYFRCPIDASNIPCRLFCWFDERHAMFEVKYRAARGYLFGIKTSANKRRN
jgi:hypothetical protein